MSTKEDHRKDKADATNAVAPITTNTDAYLALNRYEVDEENAHIQLADNPNLEEFKKLVRVCPAALYKLDDQDRTSFDHAGCLECGTCRILCGDTIVTTWEYPQPTKGIMYRYG